MRFILSFVFGFISLISFSQTISVLSFERKDNDLDARVYAPVKDQNGDVAALIKIETTETNFEFEGGSLGIVKAEKKTGEYWVYVPWGLQRITIKHPQLGILRDYVFPEKIDKATVYIMKLSTAKLITTIEEPEILTQWLVITSEPSGASIYIDDKPVGQTPFSREFATGKYQYRLELPMYHPEAGIFNLDASSDKHRIESKLKANFGSIYVNSSPETGADIILDGKPTGKQTPSTINEVLSGEHRISIKKNMYYDAWQDVNVEDNKTANINLKMNPAYGTLNITTEPSADIYIENSKQGTGSLSIRKTSGFYTIEARKDKHTSDTKKVEVKDGENINITLSPTAQYGILKINTTPPDAEIYIDGIKKGTSPTTIRQVLVGDYKIELKLKGYADINKTVNIKHNQSTEIKENFKKGMQISISSNPTAVDLEIDGKNYGKTPFNGILTFGEHKLKLTNNTKIINENINISQGGKTNWSFDLSEIESFTDSRDGNVYKTVKIGNQVWMAENLKYLPSVVGSATGSKTTPYYYVYDYKGTSVSSAKTTTNYKTYGVLYNWPAAKKSCPNGWHLPSDSEWTQMENYLANNAYNYDGSTGGGRDKIAKALASKSGWNSSSPTGAVGNTDYSSYRNKSGFTALPGGYRYSNGYFNNLGNYGSWWSATENDSSYAWIRILYYYNSNVFRSNYFKVYGYSVRCVRD